MHFILGRILLTLILLLNFESSHAQSSNTHSCSELLSNQDSHLVDTSTSNKSPKRIGLFVGSFDPPHEAHKNLLLEIKEKFQLDSVYVLADHLKKYKPNLHSADHRTKMLEILFKGQPGVVYTIPHFIKENLHQNELWDIAKAIKEEHPKDEVYVLMGTDTFEWYASTPQAQNNSTPIIVSLRNPSTKLPSQLNSQPIYNLPQSMNMHSSAAIRSQLAAGEKPEALPTQVLNYIQQNNLYSIPNATSTMGNPQHWLDKEKSKNGNLGNIGIEVVANPDFYTEILAQATKILKFKNSIRIVDFGAGTGKLARDLMLTDPSSLPGTRMLNTTNLRDLRQAQVEFVSYEKENLLVTEGQKALAPFSPQIQQNLRLERLDLAHQNTPQANESVDLSISRNLLMHLDQKALQKHLSEVHRILAPHGHYQFVILNPDYQLENLRYFNKSVQPATHEAIDFTHGEQPNLQSFRHYYRSQNDYIKIFNYAGFTIQKIKFTQALPGWEATHARYYNPQTPLFLFVDLVKE